MSGSEQERSKRIFRRKIDQRFLPENWVVTKFTKYHLTHTFFDNKHISSTNNYNYFNNSKESKFSAKATCRHTGQSINDRPCPVLYKYNTSIRCCPKNYKYNTKANRVPGLLPSMLNSKNELPNQVSHIL